MRQRAGEIWEAYLAHHFVVWHSRIAIRFGGCFSFRCFSDLLSRRSPLPISLV